jgi:Domain of unknown function (DUF4440)
MLLLLVVGSLPLSAQRTKPSSEESKLIALENVWNQAQLHHDSQALNGLVSDTFVFVDTDGSVMNKAEFLKDIQDPEFDATLITNSDVKAHVYQTAAVVYGGYHAKGTYKGKAFDHYGRFTDTWVFKNNEWQCVASHTSLLKK